MFRLLNSHLQAYSLRVKSQDAVHILGSQCVGVYQLKTGPVNPFLTGKRQYTIFLILNVF